MNWINGIGAIATAVGVLAALFFGLREVWERRRAAERFQAERTAAWTDFRVRPRYGDGAGNGNRIPVTVVNTSEQPVYEMVVIIVLPGGDGPKTGEEWVKRGQIGHVHAVVPVVPPGDHRIGVFFETGMLDEPDSGDDRIGVEIAFSDQAGRHWVRRGTGQLARSTASPRQRYSLAGQVRWISFEHPSDGTFEPRDFSPS